MEGRFSKGDKNWRGCAQNKTKIRSTKLNKFSLNNEHEIFSIWSCHYTKDSQLTFLDHQELGLLQGHIAHLYKIRKNRWWDLCYLYYVHTIRNWVMLCNVQLSQGTDSKQIVSSVIIMWRNTCRLWNYMSLWCTHS